MGRDKITLAMGTDKITLISRKDDDVSINKSKPRSDEKDCF